MNYEEINKIKSNRFLTSITYLTCAKCGNITKVRNDEPMSVLSIFIIEDTLIQSFKCPHCKEEYEFAYCKIEKGV